MFAVPTIILGMLDHPKRSDYDLSSLKVILTGGAKLNPEVALRIRPELGCEVQQVLGMAEGFLFWNRLGEPDEVNLFTQGRPQSPGDEFKIVDPARRNGNTPRRSGRGLGPRPTYYLWVLSCSRAQCQSIHT